MKKVSLFLFFGFLVLISSQINAQINLSFLHGVVMDSNMMEPIPFCNLILMKGQEQIAGTSTDGDGKYEFSVIPSGAYTLLVTYVGMPNLIVKKFRIEQGVNKKDIWFPKENSKIPPKIITTGGSPLMEFNTTGGRTYSAEEIGTTPFR